MFDAMQATASLENDKAETCGVTVMLGWFHKGLSSAMQSLMKTRDVQPTWKWFSFKNIQDGTAYPLFVDSVNNATLRDYITCQYLLDLSAPPVRTMRVYLPLPTLISIQFEPLQAWRTSPESICFVRGVLGKVFTTTSHPTRNSLSSP